MLHELFSIYRTVIWADTITDMDMHQAHQKHLQIVEEEMILWPRGISDSLSDSWLYLRAS